MKPRRLRIPAILSAAFFLSCGSPGTHPTASEPQECIQSPSRVHQLTRHLSDEALECRESATAQLIALGPDALAEIRDQFESVGDPETQARLNAVIEVLAAQDRLVRRVGRPPLVSVSVCEKPLVGALDQLSRQSGMPVLSAGLPLDLKVSMEASGVPVWMAIDNLCRSHGGIKPIWSTDRVTLVPGVFVETPHVEWRVGPIPMGRLWLQYASVIPDYQKEPVLETRVTLLLSPGRRLFLCDLFVSRAECPTGGPVSSEEGECIYLSDLREAYRFTNAGSILLPVKTWLPTVHLPLPHEIVNTRGTAYFHLSPGTKGLAILTDLRPEARSQELKRNVSMYLQEMERTASETRIKFWTTHSMISGRYDRVEGVEGIRLVSKSGRTWHPTDARQQYLGSDMGADDWHTDARFAVDPDVELTALELLQPDHENAETIRIEFDFPMLAVIVR